MKIDKRKLTLICLFVPLMVASILVVGPIPVLVDVPRGEYRFKTENVSPENKHSRFRWQDENWFLARPGQIGEVIGFFKLDEGQPLTLQFGLVPGETRCQQFDQEPGVEFTLSTGGARDRFIVREGENRTVAVDLAVGRTFEVAAAKTGPVTCSTGVLRLKRDQDDLIVKYAAIFAMWLFLFIYLVEKGHPITALNAYTFFLLCLLAEQVNFGSLGFSGAVEYFVVATLGAFASLLLYQEIGFFRRLPTVAVLLLSLIVYAIPALFIIYSSTFGQSFSEDILFIIMQTTPGEAYEFVLDHVHALWLIALFFATLAIAYAVYKQENLHSIRIERSLVWLMASVLTLASWSNISDARILSLLKDGIHKYNSELAEFRQHQKERLEHAQSLAATKLTEGEIYVVIIGESHNREHMSLYGYHRETTPQLQALADSGELLVFEDAYSSYVHTMAVLSRALTQANQLNGLSYYEAPSLIEVLRAADFETHWISNQRSMGAWDNLVSVVAKSADRTVWLNKAIGRGSRTEEYDGAALPEIKRALSGTQRNKVVFVHLMGSHGSYCSRFPDEYKHYANSIDRGEFGAIANTVEARQLNCYDNSVRYNDNVVASIVKMVRDQSQGKVSAVVYFSDHGQDVLNGLGHNPAKFTYEMTSIPLLVFLSDAYKAKYGQKYQQLSERRRMLFPNDLTFDLLLGLFDIDTPLRKPEHDLSDPNYQPFEFVVMDSTRNYDDEGNVSFIQKRNVQTLVERGLTEIVIPARVNTIGIMAQTARDGYRAFETDVLFKPSDGLRPSQFAIGNGPRVMSGMSLAGLLGQPQGRALTKLWLDIKNLGAVNVSEVLEGLERLDAQHGIKERVVIHARSGREKLGVLAAAGYHTAFALQTDGLRKLWQDNNAVALAARAKELAAEASRQKVAAIAFDYRLYPFVKGYLEPNLAADVVYHLQDLSLSLSDKKFGPALRDADYFGDDRVKTVLVSYQSPFSL